jgi:hypothetical protein
MINYNIPKPDISPKFTIDDIHKIRYWHYEMLKDATAEERLAYYAQRTHEYYEKTGFTMPGTV